MDKKWRNIIIGVMALITLVVIIRGAYSLGVSKGESKNPSGLCDYSGYLSDDMVVNMLTSLRSDISQYQAQITIVQDELDQACADSALYSNRDAALTTYVEQLDDLVTDRIIDVRG